VFDLTITVPFNKMQTLKFKAQLSNAFFAIPNEMFELKAPPSFRLLPNTVSLSERFDYCALCRTWKLKGGATKHLIDSSEKVCQLRYEFLSPHVIERYSRLSIIVINYSSIE